MEDITLTNSEGVIVEKRFFIFDKRVPFDEDAQHEFKGHTNLCMEEIPIWARDTKFDRASRQPISKNLNAFLNMGLGGTVYIGIADTGNVFGIHLNQYKMDHMIKKVEDLMGRYKPHVHPHRYKVIFTPVISPNMTKEELANIASYDPSKTTVDTIRKRPHVLRSSTFCWCDKVHVAVANMGVVSLQYIIEIQIAPWNPNDPRNQSQAVGALKTHPIHEDENGKVYMRRDASTVECSRNDLIKYGADLVENHYSSIIENLKKQKNELFQKVMKAMEK